MHGTNPYAQAGWYNPANPHTINSQPWGVSEISGPSIFGALPFNQSHTLPTTLTFLYVCLAPNVLNCMITGPTSIPYIEVSTVGTRTLFNRRSDGRTMAVLDWSTHPTVEMHGSIVQHPVSSWLRLSSDRARRIMTVKGKDFMWVTRENCISLAELGQLAKPLARIYQVQQAINLELTTEAFGLGLLDACTVATVAFYSGRAFD